LRLCLIGASIAVAFVALGFIAGGTAASASEGDAEGAGALNSLVEPVAALVSPVTEHAVAPSAPPVTAPAVNPVVEPIAAPVLAPPVAAVIAPTPVEQVATPLAGPLEALLVDAPAPSDLVQVVVDEMVLPVISTVETALDPVDALVPSPVVIPIPNPLPRPGEIGSGTSPLTVLHPAGPAVPATSSDSSGATAAIRSALVYSAAVAPAALHGGRPFLDNRHPSTAPFSEPAESPALPAAPPVQSGRGVAGAGGGGGPSPSDFPGALAQPLLAGVRHVASGADPVPVSPVFDLGSRPD
jgi:hypothetical protein